MTPFVLDEPSTMAEAIGLLDPENPLLRPIAGGTALMLMMKAGMFRPERLISLRKIEECHSAIRLHEDGSALLGGLVRLGQMEQLDGLRNAFPILNDVLPVLSNARVRNVATIGGNLAHADPHMDLPPVLMALGAEVNVIGPSGTRAIAMADLLTGYYETDLEPDELIASVFVPSLAGNAAAYIKCTTRSAHDWPALGVAVSLDLVGNSVREARIVVSAAVEKPTHMVDAETLIKGEEIGDEIFRAVGEMAAKNAEVIGDVRGSESYKKQLIRVNVARALAKALTRSQNGAENK